MRGLIPKGLFERFSPVLAVVLVITVIVWLDLPKLLWPAFILTLIVLSLDRRRRGVYPWPPRKRPD